MIKVLRYSLCLLSLATLSGCLFMGDGETCTSDTSKRTAAADGSTFLGTADLANTTYHSLTVNGTAHVHNITVTHDAVINGTLEGDGMRVGGNLTVNGSCVATHVEVAQKTDINGYLEAVDSTFKEIEASAMQLLLKDSTTGSILIRKPSSSEHKQQVVLLDRVTVRGNIVFEKEGGKVEGRNGTVIEGKVVGGINK